MKSGRKKYIKILLGIACIFILLNIIEGFIEINQEKVNNSIDNYFDNKSKDTEEGKAKIFSYKQLGNKKFGLIINQYSLMGASLHHIHGNSEEISIYPVRFKIISFLGFNKVISSDLVSDEKENSDMYREKLPQSITDELNDNYNEYVDELKSENEEKIKKIEENNDWQFTRTD